MGLIGFLSAQFVSPRFLLVIAKYITGRQGREKKIRRTYGRINNSNRWNNLDALFSKEKCDSIYLGVFV